MTSPLFSYEDYLREFKHLCTKIPKALLAHPVTRDLAPEIEGLLQFPEKLFTVAIVGGMRVGKSSLLNAIVDREGLAITGVEETTATINWFKYTETEKGEHIRVTWKDKPAESFPIEERDKWVGTSEQAERTAYIELFANSSFLRKANIVDTPGTRSVIESHEDATQGFLDLADLADKLEKDTRRLGKQADAIVYVFSQEAHKNDEELLDCFARENRIAGSSAYNSIGVIHKWDNLSQDSNVRNPVNKIAEKARLLERQMDGKISTVLPVSAPLHLASLKKVDNFWKDLHRLTQTKPEELEELLDIEEAFNEDKPPSCPLTPTERSNLRKEHPLPWATLALLLRQGIDTPFETPKEFKDWARNAGGVDRLREELKWRFFDRAEMIRSFGLLSKADATCYKGRTLLLEENDRLDKDLQNLHEHLHSLDQAAVPSLDGIRTYLEHQTKDKSSKSEEVKSNLRDIDGMYQGIKEICREVEHDLNALEHLEDPSSTGIPTQKLKQCRTILGAYGTSLKDRTKDLSGSSPSLVIDQIDGIMDYYKELGQRLRAKPSKAIERVIKRLEQIAEHLENHCKA
jgi:GTPase Era involved in 16S rRNA processing